MPVEAFRHTSNTRSSLHTESLIASSAVINFPETLVLIVNPPISLLEAYLFFELLYGSLFDGGGGGLKKLSW